MKKVDLPRFSERIRGFTLPEDGVMYIFDDDEVFKLDLDSAAAELLERDPDLFAEQHPGFLGVSDNPPLAESGNATLAYTFDPSADTQAVKLVSHGRTHEVRFRTLSGDWFVATLTADDRYLIIAEPYLLEVYKLA
jgi:hypothetical protein